MSIFLGKNNFKLVRFFIIILFAVLISGILAWQFWPGREKVPETPGPDFKETEPRLTFQLSKHEGSAQGYGYGIKNETWRGDTLEVIAFNVLYGCAEKKAYYDITEDYYEDGRDLLRIYLKEFGERDNRQSDYDIILKLGPLEKKDYEVMVFTEHIDSSLFCYEEWNKVLSQMEQHKFCEVDEDCFALSCGCYNNDAIFLKDVYENKGCQMPKYECEIVGCMCLDNQCIMNGVTAEEDLYKSNPCNDNFDCPDKMKCEKDVCVDVGCLKEGWFTPITSITPEGFEERKHMATECCEGLKAIPISEDYDENCNLEITPPGLPGSVVCSNCGNGNCEEWESKCNCPKDCK
jgi:hypothetical protein